MRELMNLEAGKRGFRGMLLTTVSTAATLILGSAANSVDAMADEADRPTVWIELGGNLEHVSGAGEAFAPAFLSKYSSSPILQESLTPVQAQELPAFSFGGTGEIAIRPKNSNWVFDLSVRYGRSSNAKDVDHQTNKTHPDKYRSGAPNPSGHNLSQENFADTQVTHKESHSILDFKAGRDVGLGLFGERETSIFSLGVRIAQFSSRATMDLRARPDLQIKYLPSAGAPSRVLFPYFHTYHALGSATRSFHGVGPTLSWNGSVPVLGNPESGEVSFDWGANAAMLFGRQRAHVRHQETARYFSAGAIGHPNTPYTVVYQNPARGHDTNRAISVPNVGGFAGASWRLADVKVSLGYRADFFFGAIDGGIDTRKSGNIGFYGPFASVSVGFL